MTHLLKGLPHKHEELGCVPRSYIKKTGTVAHTWNPSMGVMEARSLRFPGQRA